MQCTCDIKDLWNGCKCGAMQWERQQKTEEPLLVSDGQPAQARKTPPPVHEIQISQPGEVITAVRNCGDYPVTFKRGVDGHGLIGVFRLQSGEGVRCSWGFGPQPLVAFCEGPYRIEIQYEKQDATSSYYKSYYKSVASDAYPKAPPQEAAPDS